MQPKNLSRWKAALICASIACFVLSAPCGLLGVLGLIGIAADVGVAENNEIGFLSLRVAMILMSVGVIALIAGLVQGRWNKTEGD